MVEIQKRPVRTNGFGCPLHPSQIFTYLLFFGDLCTYYGIDMVSYSHNKVLSVILSTIYAILAIGTSYYGYKSTKINPTDPTIELEK